MKTELILNLRTGEKLSDTISLEKSQVKACQLVGTSVTDLIR